jgi:hypothetical protein
VSAKARQLSDDYLAARTRWLKELTVFSNMIEGHESKSRSSPLEAKIESLLNAPTLSKAEKTQLRELREVKASFDLQNERRKQLRMSARQIKVDERIELAERQGRYDPLDEERITPAIKPVVPPLKNLAFLGTDGGTVVGDT